MNWKPDTLWWIITGACNLKCKHCYIEAPKGKYGQITTKQAFEVVDKVISAGIYKFFITGGEPFLRTDILSIFEHIYERGGKVTGLESNGTIMNEKILSFLKEKDIFVNISHDGINFMSKNRGGNIEDRILKTIKLLVDRGVTTNVNTVVIPNNKKAIIEIFYKLKDIKINQWLLFSPFNTGNYLENYRMLTPEEEIDVYKSIYNLWLKNNKPFHIRLGNTFDSTNPNTKWENYICEYFRNTITLFPDGQITPCCKYIIHKDYSRFPNIFKNSMEEILTDPLLVSFKNDKMENIFIHNPECRYCELLDKCNAGCRMESYLNNYSKYTKDHRNCKLMKLSVNIFSDYVPK